MISTTWSTFRTNAKVFAPIAASRYSTTTYRSDVADEIARTANLAPEHALAS